MKTARAKRAKLLFFIVKYANLWRSCCQCRRGLLELPIMREEDDEKSLEEPVVTFETPFSISLWLLYMISYAIVFRF